MRIWILFFCWFVFLGCSIAQLKGRLTDQEGNPLAFASIYIKNTTKGSISNKDGSYVLVTSISLSGPIIVESRRYSVLSKHRAGLSRETNSSCSVTCNGTPSMKAGGGTKAPDITSTAF